MDIPEEDFDEFLNKYYDDYKPEEMKRNNLYKQDVNILNLHWVYFY